jgi:hypothetical protein
LLSKGSAIWAACGGCTFYYYYPFVSLGRAPCKTKYTPYLPGGVHEPVVGCCPLFSLSCHRNSIGTRRFVLVTLIKVRRCNQGSSHTTSSVHSPPHLHSNRIVQPHACCTVCHSVSLNNVLLPCCPTPRTPPARPRPPPPRRPRPWGVDGGDEGVDRMEENVYCARADSGRGPGEAAHPISKTFPRTKNHTLYSIYSQACSTVETKLQ